MHETNMNATDYTIRLATLEDSRELARLRWDFSPDEVAASGQPFEAFLEGFRAFLAFALASGSWTIWVVEQNGRLTHNIWVHSIRKVPRPGQFNNRIAYITNVYADPDRRGQGIGTELLRHVIEWGREQGFELLFVWSDTKAVSYYLRSGFVNRGEVLEYLYED
jgi:GNAT superfamily N-acetyltransferase